jgi:hypothetical protein
MNNLELQKDGSFKYRSGRIGEVVEIEVDYELGGANYMSGGTNRRGVYAYIRPMEITGDGFTRFKLCGSTQESGVKFFIMPLARKSTKKIADVAGFIDPVAAEVAARWKTDMHPMIEIMRGAVNIAKEKLLPKQSAAAAD